MFDTMGDAIDDGIDDGMGDGAGGTDPDTLTIDDLTAAITTHEQRTATLALAIARLEQHCDHTLDGSLSMHAWLRGNCRMANRDTSAWLRLDRFLAHNPRFATAATSGRLSASQITAIRAVWSPRVAELMQRDQQLLIDQIAPLTPDDTVIVCRHWRHHADTELNHDLNVTRSVGHLITRETV